MIIWLLPDIGTESEPNTGRKTVTCYLNLSPQPVPENPPGYLITPRQQAPVL